MTEKPVEVNFIELETGHTVRKKVTEFLEDKSFLDNLNKADNYQVGTLVGMEVAQGLT